MRLAALALALIFSGCVSRLQIDPHTLDEYSYFEWAWDDNEDSKCRDIVALTKHLVMQAREDFGTNKFHTVVVSVWDGTNQTKCARFNIRGAKKE